MSKIAHRDHRSSGVGTGRALNSDEVVCLDIISTSDNTSIHKKHKIATGWVDGAVRIFDVLDSDLGVVASSHHAPTHAAARGLAHSLLLDDDDEPPSEFVQREPLLLHGHSNPVRTVAFDRGRDRLASGGSDGTVVLWDIVTETGLFRLLGHRAAVTDVSFVHHNPLSSSVVVRRTHFVQSRWSRQDLGFGRTVLHADPGTSQSAGNGGSVSQDCRQE